jgi:hypothetical protein
VVLVGLIAHPFMSNRLVHSTTLPLQFPV